MLLRSYTFSIASECLWLKEVLIRTYIFKGTVKLQKFGFFPGKSFGSAAWSGGGRLWLLGCIAAVCGYRDCQISLPRKECLCKQSSIQMLSNMQRCREQTKYKVEPCSCTVSCEKSLFFFSSTNNSGPSLLRLDSSFPGCRSAVPCLSHACPWCSAPPALLACSFSFFPHSLQHPLLFSSSLLRTCLPIFWQ